MRAIQYQSSAQPAAIMEIESPSPQGTDVLLDMQYSALNHRDIFITKGLYPNLQAGVILGSDGVGIWDNKPYLINPNINWGTDPRLPEDDYTILGMPCNGTFCEQMVTAPDRLVEMPSHLTLAQAASLPLAGLTAYRVLFSRCQLTKQDRVCVSGIGGGVAIFVLQFALAQGAEVWVTSSSHTKIEKAIEMGAAGGFLYSDDNWHKSMKKSSGGFDVIIDSAGGPGFSQLISMANKGARIGIYGGSKGAIQNLSPQIIFWKHLNILGSTMGSDQDFTAMAQFVEKHKIVPVVDSVFKLADFPQAFDRMDRGLQFGKIVLDNKN